MRQVSSAVPLMRASVIRGNAKGLERIEEDEAQQIRDAIDRGVFEAVARAGRLSWLPIEHDMEITAAIGAVIGDRRRREWARSAIVETIRSPLIAPMWGAARRMFGLTPAGLFRSFPSGWRAVYRGVGEATYEGDERNATITLRALPKIVIQDEGYVRAMCGTFDGLLDVCGVQGSVELASMERRRRRVRYEARW